MVFCTLDCKYYEQHLFSFQCKDNYLWLYNFIIFFIIKETFYSWYDWFSSFVNGIISFSTYYYFCCVLSYVLTKLFYTVFLFITIKFSFCYINWAMSKLWITGGLMLILSIRWWPFRIIITSIYFCIQRLYISIVNKWNFHSFFSIIVFSYHMFACLGTSISQ